MPPPRHLEASTQLLVEGNDQRNFFEAFVAYLGISRIQVQNFGGVNDLAGFMMNLVAMGELWDGVQSIGIVRDAELSASSAFQSVQGSLAKAGLSVPDRPGEPTNSLPSINVLILPDDDNAGMLETLLCRTFEDTPIGVCIESFFGCVSAETGEGLHRPDKARAHAYIATQRDPHVSVGVATQRGYWYLDHAVFNGVHNFLRSL